MCYNVYIECGDVVKENDIMFSVSDKIDYMEYGKMVDVFHLHYLFKFFVYSLINLVSSYLIYQYLTHFGFIIFIIFEVINICFSYNLSRYIAMEYKKRYGNYVNININFLEKSIIFKDQKMYDIGYDEISKVVYTDKYIYMRSNKYNINFIATSSDELICYLKEKIK